MFPTPSCFPYCFEQLRREVQVGRLDSPFDCSRGHWCLTSGSWDRVRGWKDWKPRGLAQNQGASGGDLDRLIQWAGLPTTIAP